MRAASAEDDAFDGRAAHETWLAGAHVHTMLELEKAFFAVCVYVIGNGRPAELNGFFEHFLHRSMEAVKLCASESPGLAARTNAGAKERLIGIDIPDTVQQFLVQQSSFDGSLASAE